MGSLIAHAVYGSKQLLRQPGAKVKLLLLVPVAQILPFFLMGGTFLRPADTEWFFYTNLAWGFIASCALQALVWTQMVISSARLDTLLLTDRGIIPWMLGFAGGLQAVYLLTTCVSSLVIALVLGFPVHALTLGITLATSIPVTMACMAFILGCEVKWGRILHIANLALDALMILSGVLFPIAALGAYIEPLTAVLPTAHLNEFLRGAGLEHLAFAGALALAFAALGLWWVHHATQQYKVLGLIGGDRG
ncbi:hypothetical protein ACRQEF_02120 [Actinotignum sp. GS-2025a]|uniref:hypothetical protein n=1 Tax=unclassified Actinotignum TaxID=2632702 RepID=UPI003F45097F